MIEICAGHQADLNRWLARHRGQLPTFACLLSFTETGLVDHISAAGNTPMVRQYTALADGEFLHSGRTIRYPFPPLAAGVSPAIISRAVIVGQSLPLQLLSTGLPAALSVPHTALAQVTAKSVDTGQAMTIVQTQALFDSGQRWGQQWGQAQARQHGSYLVLGECVVGGTTTAQAVLTALGYRVAGQMSSSHPKGNHDQKERLVSQGIARWQLRGDPSPLGAVAALGDPMQPVAAGIALAASRDGGVLLAGGAQMLAVYALAKAIATEKGLSWQSDRIVVGTTRWVIEDISANTTAIAQAIGAPYLASQIDFSQSPYARLRAYERGFVKEGVGAGGCAIAAHLYQGWTRSRLRHAVEAQLRAAY
ncbi:MAG: TIGR00303 family protein [Phormidesmis sp.]